MKKMMKKLAAALLALSCMPITAVNAFAVEMPWYWGTTTWDVVAGEEPINDHGMLTQGMGSLYEGDQENMAILVMPRQNAMRFVLREDADLDTAPMQMAQIIDTYFPGILDGFSESAYQNAKQWRFVTDNGNVQFSQEYQDDGQSRVFELFIFPETVPDDLASIQAKLLLAFAQNHLISEFYGCGATAIYSEQYNDALLEDYPEDALSDWDSVQTYLSECDPAYTLEKYKGWEAYNGQVYYYYRVNGIDALSFREKIEFAGELYEQFGLMAYFVSPESMVETNETALGHNALENRGDVTLDLELDILDVIALNKQLLGASALCDTAAKNADINGSGTPDETDSLALLKYVVGISEELT